MLANVKFVQVSDFTVFGVLLEECCSLTSLLSRCLHISAGLPVSSSLSLPAHHWEAVASANALVLLMLSPQEKRLISKFFEEISLDTGKYVFGVKVGGYDVHIGLLILEHLGLRCTVGGQRKRSQPQFS